MRPIDVAEFRVLLRGHRPPCVSLYVRGGPGSAAEGASRLARLVEVAASLLRGKVEPAEARALLDPVLALRSSPRWTAAEGVAIFRSPDLFRTYRVASEVPELAVVARTFHTRPLLRHLNAMEPFYVVVALRQEGRRVFEGKEDGFREIAPDVDLDGRPVVLAGTEAARRELRAACPRAFVLDEGIPTDRDELRPEVLAARARRVVREHEAELHGGLLARLSSAAASGRARTALPDVAAAATGGLVEILLYSAGPPVWGRLDRATGDLELHEAQRDEQDDDVIDDLAEVVLLAGGDVHELPAGSLPASARVAAICR
jgi:hypothetical protein